MTADSQNNPDTQNYGSFSTELVETLDSSLKGLAMNGRQMRREQKRVAPKLKLKINRPFKGFGA
jgi:hypothetical protein